MAREEFVGEEYGGIIESYTIEISDAYYATVPMYDEKRGGDGHMLFLHWLGKTDVAAQPIMDANSYHPSFKCGTPKHQDWQSIDGGKTAKHPDPDVSKFDPRTDMGKLNTRMLKLTEHLEGKPDDPLAAMDPRVASEWVGFVLKMQREEFEFTRGNTNEKFTYSLDLPVEFIGKGVGLPAAAATTPTPAPATSDGTTRAAVVALAKASPDYVTFQRQALSIAGVTDDGDLLTSVLDEQGGIWVTKA